MAKKKESPRCARCTRMWPNTDHFRPGCVQCYESRQVVKKPKEKPFIQETSETPPAAVTDDNGTLVPDALLPVFRMVKHFNQFEQALNKAAKLAKEIENVTPLKGKRPMKGQKHYGEMFGPIRAARLRVKASRPAVVCACSLKTQRIEAGIRAAEDAASSGFASEEDMSELCSQLTSQIGCDDCEGTGWFTEEEADAIEKAKGVML